MGIGNLTRGLAGKIGEAIVAHGSTNAVDRSHLPISTRPDTKALMRIRPRLAVRGHVKLLEG